MSSLSVIIITKNEERNIADCLASAAFADEIIVVDACSTDRTVEIAQKYTAKVYVVPWQGYAANKTIALNYCQSEWVLWLDADERVPADLASEIKKWLAAQPRQNGFSVARRAFFLGRWIKHCGWYPGYVLRLFRRTCARFNDHLVHEGVEITGEQGYLQAPLDHYTDRDLEHYLNKFNHYTSLAARDMHRRNRRASLIDFLLRPPIMFIKMYFFKLGFLDGVEGFMLCLLSANYVAAKYAKLAELYRCKEENN